MKKPQLTYEKKRQLNAFVFTLPFLLGFLMFFAIPLAQTIKYSFNEVSVGAKGGMDFTFVGIQNYINLFTTELTTTSSTMLRLFVDENTNILINTPLIVIFSLFLALLANRKFKGRTIVRIIFFLPIILGVEVVVDMLAATTGSDFAQVSGGMFSESMVSMLFIRYLSLPRNILAPIITFVDNIFTVISQSGVQTLIYLAALQSISPSLYEVAQIEGATNYETFWKVTIPSIIHITFFVVIYTIVDLFLASSIAQEAYSFAFEKSKIGVGSALSVVYIFNVIIILLLAFLILGKVVKRNEK